MLLLRPLEGLPQLQSNAKEVVCERLKGRGDFEGGELSGGVDGEGAEALVLPDEGTEVGGRHEGDFGDGDFVGPSLDVVDQVGGQGELGEGMGEGPHALCSHH
jgi:hypothetical protein